MTVDPRRGTNDLSVSSVVVSDAIVDYSSAGFTANNRCPVASVSDVTVHRDEVKLAYRVM